MNHETSVGEVASLAMAAVIFAQVKYPRLEFPSPIHLLWVSLSNIAVKPPFSSCCLTSRLYNGKEPAWKRLEAEAS
ncbi:uncharacterized protein FFB14_09055 [Fusarium fujikuroi]|nr:uncharacterized protein FFB14_09055 [Fusarium fujikuroi]